MHEIEEREVDFTPDRDIAAYMRNNQIKLPNKREIGRRHDDMDKSVYMINYPSRNRASSTNVSESAEDIICAVRAEDCRRDCRNEKCKKGKLKD